MTTTTPITVETLLTQAQTLSITELHRLVGQLHQLMDETPLPETATLDEAIALYQAEQCSLGRAAELTGIDQWTFRDHLKQRNIPILAGRPDESLETRDARLDAFWNHFNRR